MQTEYMDAPDVIGDAIRRAEKRLAEEFERERFAEQWNRLHPPSIIIEYGVDGNQIWTCT